MMMYETRNDDYCSRTYPLTGGLVDLLIGYRQPPGLGRFLTTNGPSYPPRYT